MEDVKKIPYLSSLKDETLLYQFFWISPDRSNATVKWDEVLKGATHYSLSPLFFSYELEPDIPENWVEFRGSTLRENLIVRYFIPPEVFKRQDFALEYVAFEVPTAVFRLDFNENKLGSFQLSPDFDYRLLYQKWYENKE